MNRLVFEVQAPVIAADPNRADIACFVGFVARRKATPVPPPVSRWLDEQGWTAPERRREGVDTLTDIPVPIDTWEIFDHLFEWERRVLREEELDQGVVIEPERNGGTYMGAAIRSFFAQGGRKCYVVRVDDPWVFTPKTPAGLTANEALLYSRCLRGRNLAKLIPGFQLPTDCFQLGDNFPAESDGDRFRAEPSPADRTSWRGVGHLFGLPEVSFLCLPDLADAVRVESKPIEPVKHATTAKEVFVECSQGESAIPGDRGSKFFRAPRCDVEGYREWAGALNIVANLIARHSREVQLLAAVPIPEEGSDIERDFYGFLSSPNNETLATDLESSATGLASAFVQLAYPWVRTLGSSDLPEQLESPDAVLAGILARNALTRGAFHSAAALRPLDISDLFPVLRRSQMLKANESSARTRTGNNLLSRVSLFGPTPNGLALLSDVTASLNESYRPAGINRLVSSLVRAARRLGEESTFEPSGEQLWAVVRDRLNILLSGLLADGALRGESEADAFRVRCDRSTMSQNDIDNGRVIAEIQFQAAAAIEQITILLALDEGGQVSLVETRSEQTKKEAA